MSKHAAQPIADRVRHLAACRLFYALKPAYRAFARRCCAGRRSGSIVGLAVLLFSFQAAQSQPAAPAPGSLAWLRPYLARAITMQILADAPPAERAEDIAMLKRLDARFVGRAGGYWLTPQSMKQEQAIWATTRRMATAVHRAVPAAIVQGAVFEIVYPSVEQILVPTRVLAAFGQDTSGGSRPFRFEAMMYADYFSVAPGNKYRWGDAGRVPGVPDMSKLETRLWFYYRACRLLDAGCEALHFGQVELMDDADPGHAYWWELLTKVRAYARTRNHGFVLCDAHTYGTFYDPEPDHPLPDAERQLLFDFHSFPCRPTEGDVLPNCDQTAVLDYQELPATAPYGRSAGGRTPLGETCAHLPLLVELDNGSTGPTPDRPGHPPWLWSFDEISWFALQSPAYRDAWLGYAYRRVHALDSDAYFQMPGRRNLSGSLTPERIYRAVCRAPEWVGQEATIWAAWATPLE